MTDSRPEPLGALHIIPVNDLRPHTALCGCWCRPTEDTEAQGVWLHHALDGRERYESGELSLH